MSAGVVYEYKGYLGSAEVDAENSVLVGKLLFIRDAIAYSASDVAGLKRAFEEAVDDYLRSCAEAGDQPDTPCKGSFNVRVSPQLHRKIAVAARLQANP
jgi:predicted HicB family RNase H-like nuclease